jgi:hypothetical protein
MSNHYGSWLVLAAAVIAGTLAMQIPLAGQGGAGKGNGGAVKGKAAPKTGPVRRFADGIPDIQGYWETRVFFTAFDLEEHKEATFEIPAGPGVVVDPPDGKIPYQPWAAAKKKDIFDNHLADDPQAHCFLSGVPRQIYTPFGFQILQPEGAVVFFFEAFHAYRLIHLDGRFHPDQSIKMFQGDSRGHWEGDTLVVDTANLNGRTWFDMAGNFQSDRLRVVERFTPTDENTIQYEATMNDPQVYTRPWKIAFPIGRNLEPDYEILEYACVEGEQDLQHYTESVGGARKDSK